MQKKNWIKIVTVPCIIFALLATDQTYLTSTWGTQKTLLAVIASNKAIVVELAKVLVTNAKALLAL